MTAISKWRFVVRETAVVLPWKTRWRLAQRKRPSKCIGIKEKHVCIAPERGLLGTGY